MQWLLPGTRHSKSFLLLKYKLDLVSLPTLSLQQMIFGDTYYKVFIFLPDTPALPASSPALPASLTYPPSSFCPQKSSKLPALVPTGHCPCCSLSQEFPASRCLHLGSPLPRQRTSRPHKSSCSPLVTQAQAREDGVPLFTHPELMRVQQTSPKQGMGG